MKPVAPSQGPIVIWTYATERNHHDSDLAVCDNCGQEECEDMAACVESALAPPVEEE